MLQPREEEEGNGQGWGIRFRPGARGLQEETLRRASERWAPGGRGAQGITPTHAGAGPTRGDPAAGAVLIDRGAPEG